MQTGAWTIAKSLVGGQPRYLLYRFNEILSRHATASDAQAVATLLTATEQGHSTLPAEELELSP